MENKFVTRRSIKHTDNHFDIEELRTDEDGNEVWAVTFCSEDEMFGYIDTNAEYRLNARHLNHIEETYGKDWEQVADAIRPLIAAAEAEIFTDGFCDPQLNCHNIAVEVAAYNVLHAVPANKEWAEKRLVEETEKRIKYLGGDTNKV